MNAVERRAKQRPVSIQTRADGTRVISGYAAVFYQPGNPDTEYELWDGCFERVAPGAFNRALAERQDVVCAVNHEQGELLGRTASGTCRLSVDGIGLKYEADLPKTTTAADVAELIGRGDIPGSSFSFTTRSVQWTTEPDESERRVLIDVDLYDVGPVTWPAYKATTTAIRSERSSIEAEREERRMQKQGDADTVAVRARMLALENE